MRGAVTRKRTGRALFAALVLVAGVPARAAPAEVELSASTETDEVPMDGTLALSITATYATKGEPGELEFPAFKDFDPKDAPKLASLPLHPGAERAYREAGLLK